MLIHIPIFGIILTIQKHTERNQIYCDLFFIFKNKV